MRAFENELLRKIFEPERNELTEEWRRLHDEELQGLFSPPNYIRVITLRKMRWDGTCGTMVGRSSSCRVLKPE